MKKFSAAVFLSLSVLALPLTGCNSGIPSMVTPAVRTAALASGGVHGGNQAVSGATIQVYNPGTSGYGSAATPLNTGAPILTDSAGAFSLTSLSCPSGPSGRDRLYITATGGNPGISGASVNNDALFLMTVVDNCQTLTSSSFFSISEVSTVASIYALAQFMNTTTGSIGAYGSSMTGLNNAFDMAITLFNPSTGLAYATTPSGSGLVPQTTIDSLANIITPCVNSTDHTSAACSALFPLTTNVAASNTGLAALQMALHPGTNAGSLYTLSFANAPFQPALASTPSDLSLSVSYHTGAGSPSGMAIDGLGNIWIADYESGNSTSLLYEISPVGVPTSFSSGATGLTNVAIDSKNTVWGLNPSGNTVTPFTNAGAAGTSLQATNSGSTPQAIAIDGGDNPWVSDSGSHVSEVNVLNSQNVAFGGTLVSPRSIAFDSAGNAWVPNSGANSLTKISAAGATVGTFTGGGMSTPSATAVDSSGNVYVGNSGGIALSEFNSSGTAVSATGYTNAVLGGDFNVAVDGSGHLWSTGNNNRLAELYNGSLVSPAVGYKSTGINQPGGIGIDPSGNVWVMDKTHISINGTFVNLTAFVGIATPAVTPLAAAVKNAQVGIAAGTPIPVSVATTALPYYTSGSAYTATLVASGGSGSYTWTSGTLPTGLSLSSAGVITGTPTGSGGAVSFTVTDTALASNTGTRSITLNPKTSLPTGTNTSNLNGQFAVLIKGFQNSTPSTSGAVSGFGVIGSLTFNGNLGTVSGTMDYTGTTGLALNHSMAGTFTVGSDLRGTLLLTDNTGGLVAMIPKQFAFSVANSYQTLYLTEMDSTSTTGPTSSGIAKLQTSTQFNTTTMNQHWVFGLDGETTCAAATGCGTTASSPAYGPISMAGRVAIASFSSAPAVVDFAALNKSYTQVAIAGTYNAPATGIGRGSITLAATNVIPDYNGLHLYYIVNSNEVFLMTAASHATNALLMGDMIAQTQTFSATPASNNSIFNGNYVFSSAATKNGDGTATYPYVTDNVLVSAASTGTGTVTLIQDENQAGLITTEYTLGSPTYSIDANGRMTLTEGGNTAPLAFYLANGTAGFGTQTPSSSNNGEPGLLKFEQQSGALACSTPTGKFSFGSYAPGTAQSISSGAVTFAAGTGTATIDQSSPSGALTSATANTFTCTADSMTPSIGRLTYTDSSGGTSVGYIVSPSEILLLNTTANKSKEGLKVLLAQ